MAALPRSQSATILPSERRSSNSNGSAFSARRSSNVWGRHPIPTVWHSATYAPGDYVPPKYLVTRNFQKFHPYARSRAEDCDQFIAKALSSKDISMLEEAFRMARKDDDYYIVPTARIKKLFLAAKALFQKKLQLRDAEILEKVLRQVESNSFAKLTGVRDSEAFNDARAFVREQRFAKLYPQLQAINKRQFIRFNMESGRVDILQLEALAFRERKWTDAQHHDRPSGELENASAASPLFWDLCEVIKIHKGRAEIVRQKPPLKRGKVSGPEHERWWHDLAHNRADCIAHELVKMNIAKKRITIRVEDAPVAGLYIQMQTPKKRPTAPEHIRTKLQASAYKSGGVDWELLFKHYDHDNSGSLGQSEFSQLMRKDAKITRDVLSDQELEKIFRDIDVDAEGSLDFHEFAEWLCLADADKCDQLLNNNAAIAIVNCCKSKNLKTNDFFTSHHYNPDYNEQTGSIIDGLKIHEICQNAGCELELGDIQHMVELLDPEGGGQVQVAMLVEAFKQIRLQGGRSSVISTCVEDLHEGFDESATKSPMTKTPDSAEIDTHLESF